MEMLRRVEYIYFFCTDFDFYLCSIKNSNKLEYFIEYR